MLFFLIGSALLAYGQASRASIAGAYTYNFARNTIWPDGAVQDSFILVLLTSQSDLINEFRLFASTRKIWERPIRLFVAQSESDIINISPNLIFVANDKKADFEWLSRRLNENPVLLVSENISRKSRVMINLFESNEGQLLFEVNKANILGHGLRINPELLMSGGNEIDVAELYRNLQHSLEEKELKMSDMDDSLTNLNRVVSQTISQLDSQKKYLNHQEQQLQQQNEEIQSGKREIARQQSSIRIQNFDLLNQKKLLDEQRFSIREQQVELSEQRNYVENQQKIIDESRLTLDSLSQEITSKNIVLFQQSELISRQRMILFLSVIAGTLVLLVLALLFRSFLNKRRHNQLLVAQKSQIERINHQLHSTNRSLFSTISQLKETQSQLVSSEKMASLGVLTAGIAHEINNPVNFIYTGINSLKKDYNELKILLQKVNQLEPESQYAELILEIKQLKQSIDFDETIDIIDQTIEDIKTGAERAAEIIKGLRNFSRVDKDAMSLADLHEGIDSALLLLRNKFKLHIRVLKQYGSLPQIECYPGKLNQAFLNILSNAIDAIEKEGTITITTSTEGDLVKVVFADTGKGIPDTIVDKIFDPFFTTKTVGKGVGLGLSITYGIIEEHGGKIVVKSKVDQGTEFTILLPCMINNS